MDDIQQQIAEYDKVLTSLERRFTAFFIGRTRVPPIKDFERLTKSVARLVRTKDTLASVSKRFRITTFQQRFSVYRTKWEQALKDIEEGRAQRGPDFFTSRRRPANRRPQPSGSGLQGDIEAAAQRFAQLYQQHMGRPCNREAVKKKLLEKTRTLEQKYGDKLGFDVHYDGKEVVVRTVKKP